MDAFPNGDDYFRASYINNLAKVFLAAEVPTNA